MPEHLDTETEIWKTIDEFPDYSISNAGRVRRDSASYRKPKKLGGRLLKPGISSNGYKLVVLAKNGLYYSRTVHRLVANAFLDPVDGCTITNHKDGDKQNNHVCNLEWSNHSDNLRHSYLFLGRQPPNRWLNR